MLRSMKQQTESGPEHTRQHQIRLTDKLEGRVVKYQEKLFKEHGVKINFSEAVRALLDRSLKAVRL